MIDEPSDPDDLFAVVRDWFRLLAAGRWAEAGDMLDEPNGYGIRWTPAEIRHAFELAYGPGCRFRASHPEGPQPSDPDVAAGEPGADVWAIRDGRGYRVDHDVPLNGSWSELTAQFEFLRRPGGLAVVLLDLHVL
ncbi:hypothetical protein [Aquisphaera insulae]|uniref:hypothetical protein n=1 Tax=Aquisphaera insulae TaxID=2712864 RepID=UPI0013EAE27B|nr:hypothetical protein [Aquisphaera insulae]